MEDSTNYGANRQAGGHLTMMLGAGVMGEAAKAAATRRYDAADLDVGWAVSKDDTRPNLCVAEHGAVTRATDGHVAIAVPCAVPAGGAAAVRLTRAAGAAAAKLAKGASAGDPGRHPGVRLSEFAGRVTADVPVYGGGAQSWQAEPDCGPVPDFQCLIPHGEAAAVVTLNAELLGRIVGYFARHGADRRAPKITVEIHGADRPVVIRGDVDGGLGRREAVALIMPVVRKP